MAFFSPGPNFDGARASHPEAGRRRLFLALDPKRVTTPTKQISLGLQGGGAYGAFSWGVLDRLLDEERVEITAISASSAGAVNAVVMTDGLARDGRAGAKAALRHFWTAHSQLSVFGPFQRTPLDYLLGRWTLEGSPGYLALPLFGALAAPGQLNPLGLNPIGPLLDSMIDFARVGACSALDLFVLATNVRTGRARIFRREELDLRMVLASACLPHLHGAVHIDGETFWDGSYVANPALSPLVADGQAVDIVIVQNNTIVRNEVPHNLTDVINRANEIAFNVALLREISDLDHLGGVVDVEHAERVCPAVAARLHLISGVDQLGQFSISSKLYSGWEFISRLHDIGVDTAERWLDEHFVHLGERSTLDRDSIYYPECQGGRG
jgi:NTE family protein